MKGIKSSVDVILGYLLTATALLLDLASFIFYYFFHNPFMLEAFISAIL